MLLDRNQQVTSAPLLLCFRFGTMHMELRDLESVTGQRTLNSALCQSDLSRKQNGSDMLHAAMFARLAPCQAEGADIRNCAEWKADGCQPETLVMSRMV